MTARELAAVLIAVFGISMVVQSLLMLVAFIMLGASGEGHWDEFSSARWITATVYLAIALSLIVARQPLASRLFDEGSGGALNLDGASLTRALLTALGAYFAVTALVATPSVLERLRIDSYDSGWQEGATKLLLGVALMLGARGATGALTLLRAAGRRR